MISEKLHVYLTSHENLNRENTKKRVPVRVGIVHVHVQVHVTFSTPLILLVLLFDFKDV